jgi:hypothetical protein
VTVSIAVASVVGTAVVVDEGTGDVVAPLVVSDRRYKGF